MIELTEQNVVEYLRDAGRVSDGEVLVQSLSGGIANVVLKIFDSGGGEAVGTDLRSREQMERGEKDLRAKSGACLVVKQPLARFKTADEWLVDIDRVQVERDCMELLAEILPAGCVPKQLWFDPENYVLAMSCAPPDSVIWKKALLAGETSIDAAAQAGVLLAMIHSSTRGDRAVEARYGDPAFFIQQRADPYLRAAGEKNPEMAGVLAEVSDTLLHSPHCLIHGDYSPKNIFLVPEPNAIADELGGLGSPKRAFSLSHLVLLDFEVAFYGHCGFDVATLINHLMLKAFYHGGRWRPFVMMADAFWETYRSSVDSELGDRAASSGGRILGALLLARVDGKSPAEYLAGNDPVRQRVRDAARDILTESDSSLEVAMDMLGTRLCGLPNSG